MTWKKTDENISDEVIEEQQRKTEWFDDGGNQKASDSIVSVGMFLPETFLCQPNRRHSVI